MSAPLVVEPVDLLTDKSKQDALRELLRLDGCIYLLADGLGGPGALVPREEKPRAQEGATARERFPLSWCLTLEARLGAGAEVTFYGRGALAGPQRFYGHERLRVQLARHGR